LSLRGSDRQVQFEAVSPLAVGWFDDEEGCQACLAGIDSDRLSGTERPSDRCVGNCGARLIGAGVHCDGNVQVVDDLDRNGPIIVGGAASREED
jgi:hypothetical protein